MEWAELARRMPAIEFAKGAERVPHVGILATLAVSVVRLGVLQIGDNQLNDRRDVLEYAVGRGPAGRQPFADLLIVRNLTGFGAVRTDVVVAAVDRNDGLPGCAVLSIFRDGFCETWHGADLQN